MKFVCGNAKIRFASRSFGSRNFVSFTAWSSLVLGRDRFIFHLFSFIFSLSSFTLNNIWDVQAALREAVLHRDAEVAVAALRADAIE